MLIMRKNVLLKIKLSDNKFFQRSVFRIEFFFSTNDELYVTEFFRKENF
jgi:hypothetical protein